MMKVDVRNVVVSGNMAAVTFKTTSSSRVSKTINLSLGNIISLIKAAKETDYEKCKDKWTPEFALFRGLLLLNFDKGYRYFCVISDQAISILEETARAMLSKKQQMRA